MSNGVTHLFIPGPTNVPDAIRAAINVPMEDHNAADFPDLTLPLFADLKRIFANDCRSGSPGLLRVVRRSRGRLEP